MFQRDLQSCTFNITKTSQQLYQTFIDVRTLKENVADYYNKDKFKNIGSFSSPKKVDLPDDIVEEIENTRKKINEQRELEIIVLNKKMTDLEFKIKFCKIILKKITEDNLKKYQLFLNNQSNNLDSSSNVENQNDNSSTIHESRNLNVSNKIDLSNKIFFI